MKARIFFTALFLLAMSVRCGAFSPSAKDIFREACGFYEKGDYKAAIEKYNRVLEMGYESGELYYNLGNSYFKDGRPGMAVLSYKRAGNFIPRDSDLESNYRYVASGLNRSGAPGVKILPIRIFNNLTRYFTVNEFAVFLALLFFIFMAAVLSHLYFNRIKAYFAAALGVIVILFFLTASLAASKIIVTRREAVVVVKEADSKFEPFERATTHFKLYEGSTVSVLDSKPPWLKVRRPDGKVGWVKSSALKRVKQQKENAL